MGARVARSDLFLPAEVDLAELALADELADLEVGEAPLRPLHRRRGRRVEAMLVGRGEALGV